MKLLNKQDGVMKLEYLFFLILFGELLGGLKYMSAEFD